MPGIETVTKKKRNQDDKNPPISTVDPQVVLDNVFKQLGKPRDMCVVAPSLTRATPIRQTAFRVQIYRQGDEAKGIAASPWLSDTFFVTVNAKGDIVNSDEPILPKYRG